MSLEEARRIETVLEVIEGRDCGACGSPDCLTFAEDVVRGNASLTDCIWLHAHKPRKLRRFECVRSLDNRLSTQSDAHRTGEERNDERQADHGQVQLEAAAGRNGLEREVNAGYCGDLLSDVMANAPVGCIWLTVQGHQNIVAVAVLREMAAVILTGDRLTGPGHLDKGRPGEYPDPAVAPFGV